MGIDLKIMDCVRLSLPKNKIFLIVGSGDPVKTFLKSIKVVYPQSKVYVLSDKECDDAWSLCETRSIDDIANELGYEIDFVSDINNSSILEKINRENCNICFVLGSRWILRESLIKYFKGCIFNYHTSDLPKYRGGGGYRWQVMNRESYINIVFHQVTVKIDEGPVFKMYKKELSAENCYPINIFKELYQFTNTIFLEFLELLKQESHNLTFQDNENGTYFPLLDNDKNGAIDLTWTKSQIIEFINAFSFPYKGAFVFYKQDKVFFRSVLVRNDEINFHPFSIGLIVNKTDNYLDFIVNDGILRVSEILNVDSESIDFCLFNLGDRFYMPQDELLKAKLYRPSNKKFILKVN